jgi:hypothetical protein
MYIVEAASLENPYLPDLYFSGTPADVMICQRYAHYGTLGVLSMDQLPASEDLLEELLDHTAQESESRVPAYLVPTFIRMAEFTISYAGDYYGEYETGVFDHASEDDQDVINVIEAGEWFNRAVIWVSIDNTEAFPEDGQLIPYIAPSSEVREVYGDYSYQALMTESLEPGVNACAMEYKVDRSSSHSPEVIPGGSHALVGTLDEYRHFKSYVALT